MTDYEELLNTARDFYNLTVGDPDVRISCKNENLAKRVELAGIRLRNSIRVMLELEKLDKTDETSI